jgi:hypothetical protein
LHHLARPESVSTVQHVDLTSVPRQKQRFLHGLSERVVMR